MVYKVIGTMSGSSLDGLDVVFVEVEEKGGNWSFQVLEADCLPFENDLKEQLKMLPRSLREDLLHWMHVSDRISESRLINSLKKCLTV